MTMRSMLALSFWVTTIYVSAFVFSNAIMWPEAIELINDGSIQISDYLNFNK